MKDYAHRNRKNGELREALEIVALYTVAFAVWYAFLSFAVSRLPL